MRSKSILNIGFIVFLALLLSVLFVPQPAYALADADNSGTYQSPAIGAGSVIYTITVSYSTSDSTNDLHTKAMYIGFWDTTIPITIQAWGNAASGIDINVDAETSAELNDAQFLAVSEFDIDAAGAAAAKSDVLSGSYVDSAGALVSAVNFLPYLRLECDGQAGNPSTAVLYVKVVVPVKSGISEGALRNLARFVNTQ